MADTTNIYDMADTWNNGATTFTAIKMNVTDTASNASSLLMDLQVGGSSKFSIDKTGKISNVAGTIEPLSSGNYSLQNTVGVATRIDVRGTDTRLSTLQFSSFDIGSINGSFSSYRDVGTLFSGKTGNAATTWFTIVAETANTLTLRNGLNPHSLELYNTWTNASNYERGFMRWSGNTLEIGNESAGTGSLRNIVFKIATTERFSVTTSSANFRNTAQPMAALCDLGSNATTGKTWPWRNIYLSPSAQVTPAANGILTFEATSNTSLTVKYRGSDGTVRSNVLTLS